MGVFAIYVAVQYAPLFWKKVKLENVVKEASFAGMRNKPEVVRDILIDMALNQLQISLDPEDIVVDKGKDRVRIRATWRVTVSHPFDKTTRHSFTVEKETVFY